MVSFVPNQSGINIAISHKSTNRENVIIVAPGFFTSKDTKTYRRLISDLEKYFDVIGMDFRGHGKSDGLYTYSAREKEDLKAVIDYAKTYHKKIGILGFSYGGAIAIIQGAEYKNIDSLICVSTPMAPEEIEFKWWMPEALRLGISKFEWGNGVRSGNPFMKKIRPIDVIGSMAIPVLFIHGTGDPTVHHRHSEKLFEAANEPKEIRVFEKGSHAEDIYRRHPNEFINIAKDWFERTM